jgi:cell division protein FtsI/penicillin-binding protein 2
MLRRAAGVTGSTGRTGTGSTSWRMSLAMIVGLGAWSLIILRLVLIQVVEAPRLAGLAERQHIVGVRLAPERGIILDRNMIALTDNLTVRSACAYPSEIESPRAVARQLASVLGGTYSHYLSKLREERDFVWVERQLDPLKAARLAELDLPGIGFLKESKRVYPHSRRACHVLGLTDVDGKGIAGIEAQMDEVLTGSEAWVHHCLDSAGRRTPTPACMKVVPRDGSSVVLTIDLRLQAIAEVELERGVRENGAATGMIVIQDPWTGEILAMASWPPFDPNNPGLHAVENQKNRAVTDQFEPGSTFKTVTACAALSTGAADASSVYYAGRGSSVFGGRRKFVIRDVHPYGWLDFRGALTHSSNIAFAQIGASIGDVPLYSCAREFGFGCPTGVELPGEVRGMLREPSQWSARSAHTIAIGQEIAVTALQLVGAYSAVANGGYLLQPKIIKAVISEDGDVISETRPEAVRRVLDGGTAHTMRELLTAVTEEGTGRNACVEEILIAGKTGTAQKTIQGEVGFAPGKHVSSFAGMAPADDPQLVCLIVIDEPEGRGLGGEVAAPVFSRIVQHIIRGPGWEYVVRGGRGTQAVDDGRERPSGSGLALASSRRGAPFETAALTSRGGDGAYDVVYASSGSPEPRGGSFEPMLVAGGVTTALVVSPAADLPEAVVVPELIGMSIRRARRVVCEAGLAFAFEGSGTVRSQAPRPGAAAAPGNRVIVSCRP